MKIVEAVHRRYMRAGQPWTKRENGIWKRWMLISDGWQRITIPFLNP